ncbi:hypothetical protein L907_05180 [Agrobacterium sp. C13]|nr:hypothetical protein L902_17310 [Agrobacterium radiobacter DSM 30147]KDR88980.1 fec I like protein [Agrobacterium tumefaciens GW4]KVK47014.1 hypothetical protein L904_05210 [Agrobacterium sp. LY4]KVK47555.1 hypothetical protein L903_05210 [Agrobacterium sp. JL28]KVK60331.1 hypothetical protein L906_05180 [Agrobacterium sp. TS45]KVK65649.1 hypothetical protein L907_05180 [Agrobacterium sp. C13]
MSSKPPLEVSPERFSEERRPLDMSIERYYREIIQAVSRKGIDQSLSHDVVHDLYIKLATSDHRLEHKSSIKAFLIRAAVNLGFDRMRRAAFETRLFAQLDRSAEAIAIQQHAPGQNLDLRKRLAALREAIQALPPTCRRVFIAHRVGQIPREDIAAAMGITRGSVDRHLRHAVLHCLEKMDQFD